LKVPDRKEIGLKTAEKLDLSNLTRENRDALFNLGFLGHCLWRLEPGLGRGGRPGLSGEKEKEFTLSATYF